MFTPFIVSAQDMGLRLDVFLKNHLDVSRKEIQENIKAGHCRVNGEIIRRVDQKVGAGQTIEIELEEKATLPLKEADNTNIVWEDAYIAVCDKPPNLVVHPCPSCTENTLLQQLLSRYPQLEEQGGWRPGIVHRLDKDTSGLLIIALTEAARLAFSELFEKHGVFKEYLCLVNGKLPDAGRIEEPIGRDPRSKVKMAILPMSKGGRFAKSEWRNLKYFPEGDFSLAAVRIYSGRTHQIRVHMRHLGFPILGDRTYAPVQVARKAPRQMLHAFRLSFNHPETSEKLDFTAMPPEDFMETILKNYAKPPMIVITGNPGCGKSTFAKKLSSHGLPYMSADQVIADLYAEKGPLQDWVARNMGGDLVDGSEINKKKLLAIMENDSRLKREFENYAHLLVYEKMLEFYQHISQGEAQGVILEIPLYFESGGENKFRGIPKIVIGVHCPLEIRRKRLRENRNWPDSKIDLIESWQWPEQKKMAACQLVVDNTGTDTLLSENAEKAFADIKRLNRERLEKAEKDVKDIIEKEAKKQIRNA